MKTLQQMAREKLFRDPRRVTLDVAKVLQVSPSVGQGAS